MKDEEIYLLDVVRLFEALYEYGVYVLQSNVKELELMIRGRISLHAGNLQINKVDAKWMNFSLKEHVYSLQAQASTRSKMFIRLSCAGRRRLNVVADSAIKLASDFIPKLVSA